MSAQIIDMAAQRAERERTATRAYMSGDARWREKRRPTLAEIMDAGPWAGRWS